MAAAECGTPPPAPVPRAPQIRHRIALKTGQPMPRMQTKFFGVVDYERRFCFPLSLRTTGVRRSPGFRLSSGAAKRTSDVPAEPFQPESVLCIAAILVADPHYRLNLTPEELFELDLPADREPGIGEDILCATLICVAQGEIPTANLMAARGGKSAETTSAMQFIHGDSGYSHQHPLLC